MGSLERRLRFLEGAAEMRRSEFLGRMTDEELRSYIDALRRMRDGKELAEDDGRILARVEELREEVRNEHTTEN